MEILYQDKRILLVVKPWGVVSTAEPGGMPDLIRRNWATNRPASGRCIGWIRQWAG